MVSSRTKVSRSCFTLLVGSAAIVRLREKKKERYKSALAARFRYALAIDWALGSGLLTGEQESRSLSGIASCMSLISTLESV